MSGIDLTYTIINFTLGGTLFFLAVTALRDNFSSRLNVVSALLFLVAGLTPIFWSLSSVIHTRGVKALALIRHHEFERGSKQGIDTLHHQKWIHAQIRGV